MNKKEREQIDRLVDRVQRTTDLIHTLPGGSAVCDCKTISLTPLEKIKAMIDHLDSFDIYLKYIRFDQEASCRDMSELLGIIESLGGKKNDRSR